MRACSTLIIGAGALLQLNLFASAETCASYVIADGTNSLCGHNGAIGSGDDDSTSTLTGADITCADEFVCTFNDCCIPDTCNDSPTYDNLCVTSLQKLTLPTECTGVCTFDQCCQPATCASSSFVTADCPNGAKTDQTFQCAGAECTTFECCIATCATGKTDGSGGEFLCTSADSVQNDDQTTVCGADLCTEGDCCNDDLANAEYCADYSCIAGDHAVPLSLAGTRCIHECDDTQCCEAVDPTCAEKIYSCPTGTTRIDSNICEGGTCTAILCCSTVTESTITEARMMRTPRSRISGTQYGA